VAIMTERERELRTWDRENRWSTLRALTLSTIPGPLRYWSCSDPAPLALRQLDVPHKCLTVACEVSRRYGYGLGYGWVSPSGHERPLIHAWNLGANGEVIDAAQRRRTATGYLGKVVPSELVLLYARAHPYPLPIPVRRR
jgi:hypothetical protein